MSSGSREPFQGFPLDMVKCKTIDAYAIAEAEYVLEGYLDTTKKVWESPLAEKDERQGVYPFHPEWSGYMGKAYRTYQFTVTAITHRKDRPIYDPLIVHDYHNHNIDVICREACSLSWPKGSAQGSVWILTFPCVFPTGVEWSTR